MAPTTQTAPATTQQPPRPQEPSLLQLPVPYFSQRDSATWQGYRMCFSSTCAMAAAFLKPGCLAGAGQPDDRYLALVERFGDTTGAEAQVKALERLGIQDTFRTDGCIEQLIAQLRLGIPIPVGWRPRLRPQWGRALEPGGGLGSTHQAGADARPIRGSGSAGRRLREHRHRER